MPVDKQQTVMSCQEIEKIVNELKVDSAGRIRGKSKVIDKIHSAHLKKVDSDLMDIRVFMAKLSVSLELNDALKMIDNFIYQKQIS